MQAYFEPSPMSASCPFCTGREPAAPLPEPINAVYCISLQEQAWRTEQAVAHFHAIGLCRHVTFYRPARGNNGAYAIWQSHRAVAHDALQKNCRSALVLEDDVLLLQPWRRLAARIARALAALPADWQALYLGHIPLQAYFVRFDILRVRSACTHAYIAGAGLLRWLAATEPLSEYAPTWRLHGGIDGAFANRPGMYALFPMAARQRAFGDARIASSVDESGRPRAWTDKNRWRNTVLFRGARATEALAVALSPLYRLTLERARRRSSEPWLMNVGLIRGAGLFDDDYYLAQRPDVAARQVPPLRHYLEHGAAEGAWPCPLFDPGFYAGQNPELGRQNPLLHYIGIGAAQDRSPHPLFDAAFYRSRYGATIPAAMSPLAHFLNGGGTAGFDPHPLFDSGWYLSCHPQLRALGRNPLVHYLDEGWRQGCAPHPQFDGARYLQDSPEAMAAGINPLEHFVRRGQVEGRAMPQRTSR